MVFLKLPPGPSFKLKAMPAALIELRRELVQCELCPRLRGWSLQVAHERRRAFAGETYWGLPVPAFGDQAARLLLVGLAPAAHGANRTGRMFTGDRSGDFLYAALYRAGFANRPQSRNRRDGLRLLDARITAAVHCAPPDNHPLPEEFERCRRWLRRELELLPRLRAVLTLGALGHRQFLLAARELGWIERPADFPFAHAARYRLPHGRWLLASYHPSQQNTFTGRLTPAMLDAVLGQARAALAAPSGREPESNAEDTG